MIVVDVETTGIDEKLHSIVSVGAVDYSSPKNTFYGECRIFDGAQISQRALEINGFTVNEITDSDKMSLELLMRNFISWAYKIEDVTIAGENPRFDLNMVASSLKRYGLENRFGYRSIDLHTVCYQFHLDNSIPIPLENGTSAISHDYSLRFVGMEDEPTPHNALTGAKSEAEAFSRLLRGRVLLDEYKSYPIPKHLLKAKQ